MRCLAGVAPPAAAARHDRSQSTSTSTPRRAFVPSQGRGESPHSRIVLAHGGGGHAFDRLVKDQGGVYDAPDYDEHERALDQFWLARGVREEAYRARLVAQGYASDKENTSRDQSKHRENASSIAELYKDPDRLAAALLHVQALFPGTNVAEMCWKEPKVLLEDPARLAKSAVTLRFALPNSDVLKIVSGEPKLLLADNALLAVAAARALQREFPKIDVSAVADVEPSLLTQECDVLGRLERLKRQEKKGDGFKNKSLSVFVTGAAGSKNATLFAKVFLEATNGGAEMHESEGGWG